MGEFRRSSRGNPYHDERGRFCSAGCGGLHLISKEESEVQTAERVYKMAQEDDGQLITLTDREAVYDMYRDDTDIQQLGNSLYHATGEDINDYIYIQREPAKEYSYDYSEEQYQKSINYAKNSETERIVEWRQDAGDRRDYNAIEEEVREDMDSYYTDFFGASDETVKGLGLADMATFSESPETYLQDAHEDALFSMCYDEYKGYMEYEDSVTDYLETSPVPENHYSNLIKSATKQELFEVAKKEENPFYFFDKLALQRIMREGLLAQYIAYRKN